MTALQRLHMQEGLSLTQLPLLACPEPSPMVHSLVSQVGVTNSPTITIAKLPDSGSGDGGFQLTLPMQFAFEGVERGRGEP
jgi:hypothetical protein